jgi:predicted RNase H-like HicB family nuclease
VRCQEEPAAISHGANEPEALDNITDALELCLEHEKELQTRKAQGGMSYTAKQLVKAAKKLGFQVKEGARHT